MMPHIIIGAILAAFFLLTMQFSQRKKLHVKWWQWILTFLAFFYAGFVLEVIVSFLEEGAARGALVMGIILGIIAAIWGVLLARFIFFRR
jgi:uncharacterized membrane protein YeaQ/YmgE (transglycosylase-associated protein family)